MPRKSLSLSHTTLSAIVQGFSWMIGGCFVLLLHAVVFEEWILGAGAILCIVGAFIVRNTCERALEPATSTPVRATPKAHDSPTQRPKDTVPTVTFGSKKIVSKAVATPPAAPITKQRTPKKKAPQPSWVENVSWEEWVGQKLLQKLGMCIVLIGMALFLKYSIENGWIDQNGRIAISALVSVGLLAIGEKVRTKYSQWFQAFTGGGLALLYFTVWAAHAHYAGQLIIDISPLMATVLYAGITALGVAASIRYNAQTIAWFSMIGGYLTPLLIQGDASPMGLVIYLAILSAGMLAVAWYKKWKYLQCAAFACTHLYLIAYVYIAPLSQISDVQQILIASGFFMLFGIIPFIEQFRLRMATQPDDIALTLLNGLAVFLPVLHAASSMSEHATGIVCCLLAAVYMGYSLLALHYVRNNTMLVNTYLVASILLIALAFLAELRSEWVAAGWAPLSVVLVYIAKKLQQKGPWHCALALLCGAVFFLGMNTPGIDPSASLQTWAPFVSAWSIQSYIVITSLGLWLYASSTLPRHFIETDQKNTLETFLHSAMMLIVCALCVLHAAQYGSPLLDWTIDIPLIISLLIFSVLCMGMFSLVQHTAWFIGVCACQVCIVCAIFFVAEGSALHVASTASATIPIAHPWAFVSLATLGITLLLGYCTWNNIYAVQSKQQVLIGISTVALAHIWLHVFMEIQNIGLLLQWSDPTLSRASTAWCIAFAYAIYAWGSLKKQQGIVYSGYLLMLIPLLMSADLLATGQAHMYECATWTVVPLAMAALALRQNNAESQLFSSALLAISIGTIVAVLGSDFIYILYATCVALAMVVCETRFKIQHMLHSGVGLLVWTATIDILIYAHVSGLDFLHTIWWAIAALAAIVCGFTENKQLLRKVGVALFLATTVKLLLVDFAVLTTGIRIGASIATGLLMIGASYLYQRYSTQHI